MSAPPTTSATGAGVLDAVEVLADPLRRRIVVALATEELCTCHLVDMTGAPQPTVSYHLKVLREAGWVRAEPAGDVFVADGARPVLRPWRMELELVPPIEDASNAWPVWSSARPTPPPPTPTPTSSARRCC